MIQIILPKQSENQNFIINNNKEIHKYLKIGQYISIYYQSQKASLMENKIYFDFNANKNKTSKNV